MKRNLVNLLFCTSRIVRIFLALFSICLYFGRRMRRISHIIYLFEELAERSHWSHATSPAESLIKMEKMLECLCTQVNGIETVR